MCAILLIKFSRTGMHARCRLQYDVEITERFPGGFDECFQF